jgi:hypothetical protein
MALEGGNTQGGSKHISIKQEEKHHQYAIIITCVLVSFALYIFLACNIQFQDIPTTTQLNPRTPHPTSCKTILTYSTNLYSKHTYVATHIDMYASKWLQWKAHDK